MTADASQPPPFVPNGPTPAQRWASTRRLYVQTVLISAVVAVGLATFAPSTGSLGKLIVISECIGLSICTLMLLLGHLPWVASLARPWDLLVCQVVAIPVGYFVGHTLGRALLGLNYQSPMHEGHVIGQAVAVLATAIISMAVWSQSKREQARIAEERVQHQIAQAELRMLRAQLEPHMLFNTLANLRALIEEDPRASLGMVDQLIVYLRGALGASRNNERTLAEEFAQVEAYLGLMKHRFGARMAWQAQLPSPLQSALVPSFLLQPLVENAVRHGLEPMRAGGTIVLGAKASGASLVITISDDGQGLANAGHDGKPSASSMHATNKRPSDHPSTSYGLEHVRKRLQTTYGTAASFTIEAGPSGGTHATLTVPLQWAAAPNNA